MNFELNRFLKMPSALDCVKEACAAISCEVGMHLAPTPEAFRRGRMGDAQAVPILHTCLAAIIVSAKMRHCDVEDASLRCKLVTDFHHQRVLGR